MVGQLYPPADARLAAGKGVIIAHSHIEAIAEFELMLHREKFGEASKKVVVEQFLDGIELSVFVLTDGVNYQITYSYTYNANKQPVQRTGSMLLTNGPQAGQTFQLTTSYSYYE